MLIITLIINKMNPRKNFSKKVRFFLGKRKMGQKRQKKGRGRATARELKKGTEKSA